MGDHPSSVNPDCVNPRNLSSPQLTAAMDRDYEHIYDGEIDKVQFCYGDQFKGAIASTYGKRSSQLCGKVIADIGKSIEGSVSRGLGSVTNTRHHNNSDAIRLRFEGVPGEQAAQANDHQPVNE